MRGSGLRLMGRAVDTGGWAVMMALMVAGRCRKQET
jgi:hypothetical protein